MCSVNFLCSSASYSTGLLQYWSQNKDLLIYSKGINDKIVLFSGDEYNVFHLPGNKLMKDLRMFYILYQQL